MTTFTKTLPTEPGYYYWDLCEYASHSKIYQVKLVYNFVDIGLAAVVQFEGHPDERVSINDMGGFWFGRVPAPGTTFTIQEFLTWIHDVVSNSTFRFIDPIINDPQDGIAATTERHRKEQG